MKKVECPSCGAIGVIRRHQWPFTTTEDHQCPKCNGFGFVLMDPAEFARRKSDFRRYGRSTRFMAFGECKEFTGLVKVRNIHNVFVPGRGCIPYGVFYSGRRNLR